MLKYVHGAQAWLCACLFGRQSCSDEKYRPVMVEGDQIQQLKIVQGPLRAVGTIHGMTVLFTQDIIWWVLRIATNSSWLKELISFKPAAITWLFWELALNQLISGFLRTHQITSYVEAVATVIFHVVNVTTYASVYKPATISGYSEN